MLRVQPTTMSTDYVNARAHAVLDDLESAGLSLMDAGLILMVALAVICETEEVPTVAVTKTMAQLRKQLR